MSDTTERPKRRLALFVLAAVMLLALAVLAGLTFPNMGDSESAIVVSG